MEASLILLSANIRILVRRFSIYHAPFAALQGRKEKNLYFTSGAALVAGPSCTPLRRADVLSSPAAPSFSPSQVGFS